MFGLFKKKTEKEKLEVKYDAMIEKSYQLSHTNRTESDKLAGEAQELLLRINTMED